MENTPQANGIIARKKMVQAMDQLCATRLWLDKRSPEWSTVLKVESELFRVLKNLDRKQP